MKLVQRKAHMNKDLDNTKPACYAPWITTYEWSNGNITPCCEWKSPDEDVHGDIIKTTKHTKVISCEFC